MIFVVPADNKLYKTIYIGEKIIMAKKLLITITLIVLAISLIGCGTVQGVGSDIQWLGEKGGELIEGE